MSAELVETAASALGPIADEVLFLGGASIHLWITDPAVAATRSLVSTFTTSSSLSTGEPSSHRRSQEVTASCAITW